MRLKCKWLGTFLVLLIGFFILFQVGCATMQTPKTPFTGTVTEVENKGAGIPIWITVKAEDGQQAKVRISRSRTRISGAVSQPDHFKVGQKVTIDGVVYDSRSRLTASSVKVQ